MFHQRWSRLERETRTSLSLCFSGWLESGCLDRRDSDDRHVWRSDSDCDNRHAPSRRIRTSLEEKSRHRPNRIFRVSDLPVSIYPYDRCFYSFTLPIVRSTVWTLIQQRDTPSGPSSSVTTSTGWPAVP